MRSFVVLQNIPSPYRIHLFNVLWKELERRGVAFHVHFMAENHGERPDFWRRPQIDFPHTYWRDYGWKSHHLNPRMLWHLMWAPRPHCLLVGSAFDTFTGIIATLFVPRDKSVLWTEGNTKTPGKMGGFIGWFKRFIFKHHTFISVPGDEGRKYVALHQQHTRWVMPPTVLLPNLIDETCFRGRPDEAPGRVDRPAWIREALELKPGERLALCPARLDPVKGLIEFFTLLPRELLDGWKVLIIGEGSLKESLERLVLDRGLANHVVTKNYVPYQAMPELYAAADLLVLPSVYDPNPLSVVEAMHSSVPLLLSKQVGNYPEALIEGETGWGFSPFDKQEVVETARRAFTATNDELRRRGRLAKEQAARFWSSEKAIQEFLDSLGV